MPTIVIASPKGGVGKSTTANILMTCLAGRGASVIGIDADLNRPQIQWAKAAGVRLPQEQNKTEPKILPSLSIIEATAENSIIATIQDAAQRTQFVVVDLEGVASQAATYAISQADLVIVPAALPFSTHARRWRRSRCGRMRKALARANPHPGGRATNEDEPCGQT